MAIVQGEFGRIRMFEDFLGAEVPLVLATEQENVGQFVIGGEDITQSDDVHGGAPVLDSVGLSGVIRLHTDNEDLDTILIKSAICFDAGLMGTLVLEVRSKFDDLETKAAFIGFSDVCDDDMDLDTDIIGYSSGTAITYRVSDCCGFYFSSEQNDSAVWHSVYKGGDATAITTTANIDLDDDAVADKFQIFRLEVDNNGTARWYIDGVLLKTLEGAMSTSTDMCVVVAVTAVGSAESKMDVDYVLVEANRDWTV